MPGRDRRDVTVDVTITSDTRGSDKAAKGLGDVDKAADKAGDSLAGMAVDAEKLGAEIELTTQRIAELDAQLTQVGNDKGVRKALRGQESYLRDLEKVLKRLEAAGGGGVGVTVGSALGTGAGEGLLAGITDALGGLPSKLKGAGITAGVAFALAAAPAVGAVLAGAVTGAVGAGGIAGGIAAASRDPAVRSAAADFSTAISSEFFSSGSAFVGPVIESLDILEGAFSDLNLGSSFARVAPYVTEVAEGIAGLGREFMPGFNRALDQAGPALSILAKELPDIGDAAGYMLQRIAESEGALEGLEFVLRGLEVGIIATGNAIGWLSDRFASMLVFEAKAAGIMEDIPGPFQDNWARLNDEIESFIRESQGAGSAASGALIPVRALADEGLEILAGTAQRAADRADRLNDELNELWDNSMSAAQAADTYEGAIDDLTESLDENGRTIDINTEKGRENRKAFRDAISTAQDLRQANIDNGMPIAAANKLYNDQIKAIEGIGAKARVTIKDLEAIAGNYKVVVDFHTKGSLPHQASVKFERFAAGGTPPTNAPYWVGEQGPELRFDRQPGYIMPAQQSMQYASAMSGGGGMSGGAVRVVIDVTGGDEDMKRMIKKMVRVEGGGSVQTAFGRGDF